MLLAMGLAAVVSFWRRRWSRRWPIRSARSTCRRTTGACTRCPFRASAVWLFFLAFLLSTLVFADIDRQMQGILLGAVMIVVLGVMDDIMALKALPKLIVQIAAAGVAVYYGCRIQFLSNPNVFSDMTYVNLGWLSVPITIIWIVAITNAVNFIDGWMDSPSACRPFRRRH